MKRRFLYIILGVLPLAAACDFHASENGGLDGFWQLAQVDTLATGGAMDMRQWQTSWAFQGHLLEMRTELAPIAYRDVIARFDHRGDTLVVRDCYLSLRDSGDIRITQSERLHPFGIHRLTEQFRVLLLNGSRMTLQSDSLKLHFRRY